MKSRLHDFNALLRCQPAGNIPATQQEKILVELRRAPLPDGGAGRISKKEFDRRGPLRFTRGSSRNQRVTKISEATRGRPPCADFTGGRFPFPASGAKASASEKRLQTVNLGNV
jgi:hypothetical protein